MMKRLNGKIHSIVLGFALVVPTSGYGAGPELAQQPLFIGGGASPNLMFIIDDSMSMRQEAIPDDLVSKDTVDNESCNRSDTCTASGKKVKSRWYYSSEVNPLYYNPNTTYLPPFNEDGSGRLQSSNYTSAWKDGYDAWDLGYSNQVATYNLENNFSVYYHRTSGSSQNTRNFTDGGFYYKFKTSTSCNNNKK